MIIRFATRAGKKARRAVRRSPLYVRHRSAAVNVYHCCVPRTASQWIRGLLRDRRVYRYSGLAYFNYLSRLPKTDGPRRLTDPLEPVQLPPHRIASPLYIGYESFVSIPKPTSYRAFFVMRDPRDVVVSWYFSMKKSHKLIGPVARWRAELGRLSKEEGLRYSIRTFAEEDDGFNAMRSWRDAPLKDPNVLVVKYEDLVGPDSHAWFQKLFEHCDIRLPPRALAALLAEHSFERLTGRQRGEESRDSQMRKGLPGDWRNHLTEELLEYFDSFAGDLVSYLGYA